MITNLLSAGQLPDPSTDAQLLYMVVLPPGTSSSGEFIGEHSFYSHNGTNVHYGCGDERRFARLSDMDLLA